MVFEGLKRMEGTRKNSVLYNVDLWRDHRKLEVDISYHLTSSHITNSKKVDELLSLCVRAEKYRKNLADSPTVFFRLSCAPLISTNQCST